ncbi:WD40-repeat-containing domain protein [Globomyces pollinis-pini]|nr:WD40-repeat-containing domain protein [Globomyces pollinis-pini]
MKSNKGIPKDNKNVVDEDVGNIVHSNEFKCSSLVGHSASVGIMANLGNLLVSADDLGKVIMWDLNTSNQISSFMSQNNDPVTSISILNDNVCYFAAGSSVYQTDLRVNSPSCLFELDEDVNMIDLHSNSHYLGTSDDSGAINVFDLRTQKRTRKFRSSHTNIASCFSFRPTTPWQCWSGGFDSFVHCWDFSTGKIISSLSTESESFQSDKQNINPPYVNSLCFTENGNNAAIGLGNGMISLLRGIPRKGNLNCHDDLLECHTWSVSALKFHERFGDHYQLISGGIDKRLCVWNIENDINVKPTLSLFVDCHQKINDIAIVNNDSLTVAVAGTNHSIDLYSL